MPPNYAQTVRSLPLDAGRQKELLDALNRHDYTRAETILDEEISRAPQSPPARPLLVMAGGLFFLDGQFENAVIAYKKAELLGPLDERSRFTLAMAEIRLNRRDWAQQELERLAAEQAGNALYLYWLARLDYDASRYKLAAGRLERVIQLDPQMMRAYDNLGLCYDALGQLEDAARSYARAVNLNRQQAHPSPWPPLNWAIFEMKAGRLGEAEKLLREAVKLDARFAPAHYQPLVLVNQRANSAKEK